MPSLIASGVSPFHQIGAGSETSTVSWPALAGLAIGIEPFGPTTSQLPILAPLAAGAAAGAAVDAVSLVVAAGAAAGGCSCAACSSFFSPHPASRKAASRAQVAVRIMLEPLLNVFYGGTASCLSPSAQRKRPCMAEAR